MLRAGSQAPLKVPSQRLHSLAGVTSHGHRVGRTQRKALKGKENASYSVPVTPFTSGLEGEASPTRVQAAAVAASAQIAAVTPRRRRG